jgi:hypothetical protein
MAATSLRFTCKKSLPQHHTNNQFVKADVSIKGFAEFKEQPTRHCVFLFE